jgi:hypothetical protein
MGRIVAALALVAIAGMTAGAETPSAFVDVPPWHWAFEAVQEGAARGIFTGYPTSDRELVANAIAQVYDAFAHPRQPAAREWAERFLINTPPDWPQPLARSGLVSFAVEKLQVDVGGDRATATFVAVIAVRSNGSVSTVRTPVQARAERDGSRHWRVDYATLATGQPQIFH